MLAKAAVEVNATTRAPVVCVANQSAENNGSLGVTRESMSSIRVSEAVSFSSLPSAPLTAVEVAAVVGSVVPVSDTRRRRLSRSQEQASVGSALVRSSTHQHNFPFNHRHVYLFFAGCQ